MTAVTKIYANKHLVMEWRELFYTQGWTYREIMERYPDYPYSTITQAVSRFWQHLPTPAVRTKVFRTGKKRVPPETVLHVITLYTSTKKSLKLIADSAELPYHVARTIVKSTCGLRKNRKK